MSQRIEDYALIGDLHTAALISQTGSLDWGCFPRFDSAAAFAAILGDETHGSWQLGPLSDGGTPAPAPLRARAHEGLAAVSAAERPRWLSALRMSILRSLTTGITYRPKVALYVLVKEGNSAADRCALALAHAGRAEFEVTAAFVDDAWKSDPEARYVLARAYAALRRGEIHGLVAASQVDISSCDFVYEQELHRLRGSGGFLDLALDETRI